MLDCVESCTPPVLHGLFICADKLCLWVRRILQYLQVLVCQWSVVEEEVCRGFRICAAVCKQPSPDKTKVPPKQLMPAIFCKALPGGRG